MKMNRDQWQLLLLWIVAITLTIIAITQIIGIYNYYKGQNNAAPKAQAPVNIPVLPNVDPKLPKTTISFADTAHDFGSMTEGDSVSYDYNFTNTGKNPLTIVNAFGSCGCTVPYWPKKPIMAGQSDKIKVVFHSAGKQGFQQKIVTLTANTMPENTRLRFKVLVNPKKK